MAHGNQVKICGDQALRQKDRLKLRQHHYLPALRIASGDCIMGHKDALFPGLTLRFQAKHCICKLFRQHLMLFFLSKPGEFCPERPPVEPRKYGNIKLLCPDYLRHSDYLHIRHQLKMSLQLPEGFGTVVVWCAAHHDHLSAAF